MSYSRKHRVNDLLREEIATAIQRHVRDPRVRLVTVVGVDVSPDLRTAKVRVNVYGDERARAEALAGLCTAAGFLQKQVSRNIVLKQMPRFSFEYDEALDRHERIETLLHSIHNPETDGNDGDQGVS